MVRILLKQLESMAKGKEDMVAALMPINDL